MYIRKVLPLLTFVLVNVGYHEVSAQARPATRGDTHPTRKPTPGVGLADIVHFNSTLDIHRAVTLQVPVKQSMRVATPSTAAFVNVQTQDNKIPSPAVTSPTESPAVARRAGTRIAVSPSPVVTTTTATTTQKPTTTTEKSTTTKKPTIVTNTPSPTTTTTTTTTKRPVSRAVTGRQAPVVYQRNRDVARQQATPKSSTVEQTRPPTPITRIITPKPDVAQYVTFTIKNNFNETVKHKDAFIEKIKSYVVRAAEVKDARITKLKIKPGSILVDFEIQPGNKNEPSAKYAAEVFKRNIEYMLFDFISPEGIILEVDPESITHTSQKPQTPEEVKREESIVEIKYILFVVMGTVAVALVIVLVTVICLRNSGNKTEKRSYRDESVWRISGASTLGPKYRLDTASDLGFHEDEKAL